MRLIIDFVLMLLMIMALLYFVIKPILTYRLNYLSDSDYHNWFSVTTGQPTTLKRDLSQFVREKYQLNQPCSAYLHVFTHTTRGKPLAIVFDAKNDHLLQQRYLDEAIDSTTWRYRPRIEQRCLEQIDQWPDYFVNIQQHRQVRALTSLQALARRYRYQIFYKNRSTPDKQHPSRFIVIRVTDIIESRAWDFELTAVSWHHLRHYADDSISSTLATIDTDSLIKPLQRALPVSWLTRPDQIETTDVIGNQITHKAYQHSDPCWSNEYGRATVGKRPVTLDTFYRHYLHGLQLPSTSERQSDTIQRALTHFYFDCLYDKDVNVKPLATPVPYQSSSALDSLLYRIVPILRICQKNERFNSMLERCQGEHDDN